MKYCLSYVLNSNITIHKGIGDEIYINLRFVLQRPTPPHLTSVQAEQMLARACENEAENAKRMRMGMEPVSQPLPIAPSHQQLTYSAAPMDIITAAAAGGGGAGIPAHLAAAAGGGGLVSCSPLTLTVTMTDNKTKMEYKPEHLATLLSATAAAGGQMNAGVPVSVNGAPATVQYRQVLAAQPQPQQPPPPTPPQQLTVYTQPTAPPQPPQPMMANGIGLPLPTNGQIDAGKKGAGGGILPPLLNHKLNGTEMTAVRQLITGYRESAAFLLRSADELEHLIQMQQKI